MVGIVIVSHSNKVAEGIYELAIQMTGTDHRILAAGGMDDGSIGTDAIKIKDAIISANDGDGVLVLADLGSGIISSQVAIELLKDEGQDINVEIADAPIFEGSISAAVQASVGDTLKEVLASAEMAKHMSKLG